MNAVQVIEACAREYGVTVEQVMGRSRFRPIPDARHLAFYLLYEGGGHTYAGIARMFRREHTGIMHGVDKVRGLMRRDVETCQKARAVKASLNYSEGEEVWVVTVSDSKGHTVQGVYADEAAARSIRATNGWRKADVFGTKVLR